MGIKFTSKTIEILTDLLKKTNSLSQNRLDKISELLNVFKYKYQEELNFENFMNNKKNLDSSIKLQLHYQKLDEWFRFFKVLLEEGYQIHQYK